MAREDRQRHAAEVAANGRIRRIEIGMSVEPDNAGMSMIEAGEDAQAHVAYSSQHQRKLVCSQRLANGLSHQLIDGDRSTSLFGWQFFYMDALDRGRMSFVGKQLLHAGLLIEQW